jgi:hypothetical protein
MPTVRVYPGQRLIRRIPISGIQVAEYGDYPGEYYSMGGEPIPDDMAAQAGFDVAEGRKEKRRRELRAEADKKIDEQIAKESQEIEEKLAVEESERGKRGQKAEPGEVHIQVGSNLRAIHRGGGRYRVVDSEGNVVTDGLSKTEADRFISDAAAAEEEEAAGG